MLVAMMSFVAHGVAMAGVDRHMAIAHEAAKGSTASAAHHDHSSHPHQVGGGQVGPGTEQAGLSTDGGPGAEDRADGSPTPCCGQACMTAIQVSTPAVIVAAVTRTVRLRSPSQTGAGIDPRGLKRPPRTPDIG